MMETHLEKPPTSPMEKQQTPTSRSGSTESFSRTRTKFLNAPIPKQNQNVTFSVKKDKQLKKVKSKKSKSKESFNPLEDEEKEKKRLQEIQECFDKSKTQTEAYSNLKSLLLKHMRVLDDLTKLRNHYYHVYLSALTDKVEQQRRNIKKSTEQVERKLKEKEKKEQAQLARRKYERTVTPEEDTFNIKELFKSHWYNVLIMEEKMKKEGKLRTIEDYDKFWEDILRPGISGGMAGDNVDDGSYYISKASLGHGSHTPSLASFHMVDTQPILPRELSFIREDTELSKSQSAKRKSSAAKQLQKLKSSASFLSAPVKGRRQDVHPKALQLDQRYPKTEMPHLRMLDMDLEPPKEDPEVVQMREEFGTRARIRNHKRKTVMNMHEMSLTHQAATSRICLNHPKFMARLEGPDINDVTSSVRSMEYLVDSQTSTLPTTLPAISWSTSYQNQQEMAQFYNEVIKERPERVQERLTSSSRGSSCSSSSSQESYNITDTDRERTDLKELDCKERSSPIPLTLDSIQDQYDIKEAKCLSTLWTNYGNELPAIT